MTIIQEKPIKGVVAREPKPYPLASKATNVADPVRNKYLRIALQLVGLIFILAIYTLSITLFDHPVGYGTRATPHTISR